MTENTTTNKPQQQLSIQKIYIKDASFESPSGASIFSKPWKPKIDVEINTNGSRLTDNQFEVILTATVTAKLEEDTAFLVEIQQAGVFEIMGFDESGLAAMLGSYCPNILFPYVRESISDLIVRGGFPQFSLTPVNFEALYAQKMQQLKQETKQAENAVKH